MDFLKEGKEHSFPASNRPAVLTNCLCELLEKKTNGKLAYFLECNGLLESCLAGFRAGRFTNSTFVAINLYIKDAFVHKHFCVMNILDLAMAYDSAWRYRILSDLKSFGVSGNLLNTLAAYLSQRTFLVRLGSTLSSVHVLENGVPQDVVIS